MRLVELIPEIRTRCGGFEDARAIAFGADLRAKGVKDGSALAKAFDEWRTSWDKRYAPTAVEFCKFYEFPKADVPEQTTRPKPQDWAERVMKLPEGQAALGGGYGRELWVWAKKNPGKIPGADVLQACSDGEARFQTRITDMLNGTTKRALKIAQLMINFEAELKRKYLPGKGATA